MRLLNTSTLEVEVFTCSDVPTYAILSHTWGKNEVTLQDLGGSRSGSKKDFSKLDKTCQVAHANGYGHVWIDTCCIDKTSSAELSEAINSMFRYYQEADVCYAFLFDLVPEEVAPLESALATCRWFTRGWTLQELIASPEIHVYDAAWSLRGTKRTMVDLISEISRVDREVLLDADELYCVPVATKMSWAATRATTRVEDMAYSLLGIFDIHLPLLYGEGLKAFRRLQEEILRKTNDMSLLAWVPEDTEQQEGIREIWARSPTEFSWLVSEKFTLRVTRQYSPELEITSKGLRVSTSLVRYYDPSTGDLANPGPPYHTHVLSLGCIISSRPARFLAPQETEQTRLRGDRHKPDLGIRLRKFGPNLYVRDVSQPAWRQIFLYHFSNHFDDRNSKAARWTLANRQTIWLHCEEKYLPFWILENQSRFPCRKFYREFTNYGGPGVSTKLNFHFPVASQPASPFSLTLRPLHGELWDSSNQTLMVGWAVPPFWEAIIAEITVRDEDSDQDMALQVVVVFDMLQHGLPHRFVLLDPEHPVGRVMLSREYFAAVKTDLDYRALMDCYVQRSRDGLGKQLVQVKDDRHWNIKAVWGEKFVPGISATRPVVCIEFEVTEAMPGTLSRASTLVSMASLSDEGSKRKFGLYKSPTC